jgi:carboxypeptidase C (cathepsin A)
MEFIKTNDAGGTSYATCFSATKEEIVKAFGKPSYEEYDTGEKVQNEWDFKVEGHIVTIYDWKEYRAYDDDEVIEWHIGTEWLDRDEKFVESVKEEIIKRIKA